ncbi:MAG: PAS domain S-box protein [Verrucomicrobiales bacterium]
MNPTGNQADKLIQILHLEDNVYDAELIKEKLHEEGVNCQVFYAKTEQAFRDALNQNTFDLAICDYNLRGYDGLSALQYAKEKQPTLPVLLISGSLGEDEAVKSLKMGATDYLLKNRLERLAPAVQRALQEAESQRLQQQTERKLKENEERLRMMITNIKDYAIIMLDPQGAILNWNYGAERMTGYKTEEVIGKSLSTFNPQAPSQHLEFSHALRMAAAEERFESEGWRLRKDGSQFYAHMVITALDNEAGDLLGFASITRDVTEHKLAEERNSELAALLDHAQEAIHVYGMDQKVTFWNKASERLYGIKQEDAIGRSISALFPENEAYSEETSRLIMQEGAWVGELDQRNSSGKPIIVESRRTLLRAKDDQPKSILVINSNITDRKHAELALAESEERFRQLAEQSNDIFWFVALHPERVIYVSPAVERVWDFPADRFFSKPRAWMELIHQEDRPKVEEQWNACIAGHCSRFEVEYRVVSANNSVRWIQNNSTPIRNEQGDIVRIGGIFKDITEQKLVEAHRLRTQRLESIGTLAGGVAHDLNNALAPILMATDLLRNQYPGANALIDILESSAKRGAEMVRQLLTFAKGAEGSKILIQPTHLFREIEQIIKRTFPKNIQLIHHFKPNLHTVLGDPTQFHQVLLNLCVNARDAMPHGGSMTLEAENIFIDATYASTISDAKPGDYVVWRVKDTGCGMTKEVLEKIFDPFFSTKGPDKGTGLGLSTVMGIVKAHNGFLQVYSSPNQGSTFSVYLPAQTTDASSAIHAEIIESEFMGNGETVLIVDDEPSVRQILCQVLTSINLNVISANDGPEGIIEIAQNREKVAIVITDVHMPDMDGFSFVKTARRMIPHAAILVSSGRIEDHEVAEFKALGVAGILEKPFTQERLIHILSPYLQRK